MWLKNSDGQPDAMLTFAFVSFLVVTFNILLSSVGSLNFGEFSAEFQPLDAAIMTTYLGATFTAYVSRRWTDRKYYDSKPMEEVVEAPPSMGG